MSKTATRLVLTFAVSVLAIVGNAQEASQPRPQSQSVLVKPPYLYKVSIVQAAPGKLTELIELYKSEFAAETGAGEEPPLWIRHSQGDHWDLMILRAMGSYSEYFKPERVDRRERAWPPLQQQRTRDDIAWQEDLYCGLAGSPADLRHAFENGGFFHVEMFVALPGHYRDLVNERAMENEYARLVKAPQNFLFERDSGASWDLFTIGVFRDLKHYAESANLTPQQQDAAARAAGFESASQIGPYLRRFISTHHDTLAVAIK